MCPIWIQHGSKMGPKWVQNWFKMGPKCVKMSSKLSKMNPQCLKLAQNLPKISPKWVQNGPKRVQKGPQLPSHVCTLAPAMCGAGPHLPRNCPAQLWFRPTIAGPKMSPKRVQNGSKHGFKIDPKLGQKSKISFKSTHSCPTPAAASSATATGCSPIPGAGPYLSPTPAR